MILLTSLVLSYLLGAVSFAYLVVRWKKGVDLRTLGSGNLGATNVARALGRKWALIVYFLDLVKGLVPGLAGLLFVGDASGLAGFMAALLLGVAAVVGHCLPLWHGFRGGKGVATASGVLLAFHWPTFLVALAGFALILFATRMISAGSIVAALLLPLGWIFFQGAEAFRGQAVLALLILVVLAAWVVFRHRANLRRILAGTEPRIGSRNA